MQKKTVGGCFAFSVQCALVALQGMNKQRRRQHVSFHIHFPLAIIEFPSILQGQVNIHVSLSTVP